MVQCKCKEPIGAHGADWGPSGPMAADLWVFESIFVWPRIDFGAVDSMCEKAQPTVANIGHHDMPALTDTAKLCQMSSQRCICKDLRCGDLHGASPQDLYNNREIYSIVVFQFEEGISTTQNSTLSCPAGVQMSVL